MCFYITATLPKDAKLEELQGIFNVYNMAFSPIKNESIQSLLRPGELYFRATKEYCDCDTILGSLNKVKEYQNLLNSKKVKTLRKKNWTEQEIDNWIKEKLEKKDDKTKRKLNLLERDNEIKRWNNFIHSLLDTKKVSRVGFMKHWYSKGLQSENVTIKKTERIKVNEITSEFLLNLEEDVLYEFFPSGYQFY